MKSLIRLVVGATKPIIFIAFVLFLLESCQEDKNLLKSAGWNLNGNWDICFIKYDYTIIDIININIIQSRDKVMFLEGTDTISSGIVSADTIKCYDMFRVGISNIFIDNNDHMHSGTPDLEYLDRLDFIRVK
jgi:hypothetical protein